MLHGADRIDTIASPSLGQHNAEIYAKWFGYTDQELSALTTEGIL